MKKIGLCIPLTLALLVMSACSPGPNLDAHIQERDGITLEQLSDRVWMHTSMMDVPGFGRFPSNGLIVLDGESSILIDTAWTNEQTASILDWAQNDLKHPVTRAVFTHAHDDKMGGVALVRKRGIQTYAHPLSNQIAARKDLSPAEKDLVFDTSGNAAGWSLIDIYYPGPGHTVDNIVVGIPSAGLLFGGCMIRPPGAKNLGNTADADLNEWDRSVDAAARRFPNHEMVVPSHGPPAGRELLDLSISLVKAQRAAQ